MKLKEFDLWGYELELEQSREFNFFIRCICAHYERHFESFDTDGVCRIVLALSDNKELLGKVDLSSSVLKFHRSFDFSSYWELNKAAKQQLILDTLHNGLLDVCQLNNWPEDNFENAYRKVLDEDFVNIFTIRKKTSKNRKLYAELIGHHHHEAFDCYIKVFEKSEKKVFGKRLFSAEPEEFLFVSKIQYITWISNDILVYQKKDKTELERFEFGDLGL